MSIQVVIENPEDCPLRFTGVEPVAARSYLTDPAHAGQRGEKVFNICQSYRYQSMGYYVSLLAEARRHKAFPSTATIQDMKHPGIIRLASDELGDLIQKLLAGPDQADQAARRSVHVYFGRTADPRFEALGSKLFKRFPAPFIRADFSPTPGAGPGWQMHNVSPVSVKEIPEDERDFAQQVASEYFAGKKLVIPKRKFARYDLAILHDPAEVRPPSDPRALKLFAKAAESLGMNVEFITRDDAGRLYEFDALFIRETTNVDHHTYRLARKAASEGLAVIDDPDSILRCTNKVFLAEMLSLHKVPIPRTLILHSKNLAQAEAELSLPCILKEPDSSFSQGVAKVDTAKELMAMARQMLRKSDLVIAQEYIPTDFDWRIGVLDNRPLFASKYYMARGHWQIIGRDPKGRDVCGKWETLPVAKAPKPVLRTALRAASLMGDGLYGVDLKQHGDKVVVMEVNDNPNLDAGCEDEVLGEELYLRVMESLLRRIEERTRGGRP